MLYNLLSLVILSIFVSCSGGGGGSGSGSGNTPQTPVVSTPQPLSIVNPGRTVFTNQPSVDLELGLTGEGSQDAVVNLYSDDLCTVEIANSLTPTDTNLATNLNNDYNVYARVLVNSVVGIDCQLLATISHDDTPPNPIDVLSPDFIDIQGQLSSVSNLKNDSPEITINLDDLTVPADAESIVILGPGGEVLGEITREQIEAGGTITLPLDVSSLPEDSSSDLTIAYKDIHGNVSTPSANPVASVTRTSLPTVDLVSAQLNDDIANGFSSNSFTVPVQFGRLSDYVIEKDGQLVGSGSGTDFSLTLDIPETVGETSTYTLIVTDSFGNVVETQIGPLFLAELTLEVPQYVQDLVDSEIDDLDPVIVTLTPNRRVFYTINVNGSEVAFGQTSDPHAISYNFAFSTNPSAPDTLSVDLVDDYGNAKSFTIGEFNPSAFEVALDAASLAKITGGMVNTEETLSLEGNRDFTFTVMGPTATVSGNQSSTIDISTPGDGGEELTIVVEDNYGNVVNLSYDIALKDPNPRLSASSSTKNGFSVNDSVLEVEIETDAALLFGDFEIFNKDTSSSITVTPSIDNGTTIYKVDIPLDVGLNDLEIRVSDYYGNVIATDFSVNRIPNLLSSAGRDTCLISSGELFCWGKGLGGGAPGVSQSPVPVSMFAGSDGFDPLNVLSVSRGEVSGCAIDSSNRLFCWGLGYETAGVAQNTAPTLRTAGANSFPHDKVKSVSVGLFYTCAIAGDQDQLYCWGLNDDAQAGLGNKNDPIDDPTPVQSFPFSAMDTSQTRMVSAGYTHACAIDNSNKLFCWGKGVSGELGQGNFADRLSPAAVVAGPDGFDPNNVKYVKAGSSSTCAIDSSDRLFCWGSNADNVINIPGTDSLVPVLVKSTGTFTNSDIQHVNINGGLFGSGGCATKKSGQLYCWGNGVQGQLGDGSTSSSSDPVEVSSTDGFNASSVKSVSVGGDFKCATDSSDVTACWGSDIDGQIGSDFLENPSSTPLQIDLP